MSQTGELVDMPTVSPPAVDMNVDTFFDVIPIVPNDDEPSPTDESQVYKSDRIQRKNTGRPHSSPSPTEPISTPIVECIVFYSLLLVAENSSRHKRHFSTKLKELLNTFIV